MTGLLELKERLIRFFGKNEIYVVPVLKFILATVVFLLINQNIGYMTRLVRTSGNTGTGTVMCGSSGQCYPVVCVHSDCCTFICTVYGCMRGRTDSYAGYRTAVFTVFTKRWLLCSADTDNICITYPIYHADFGRTVTYTGICYIYCERNCDVLFPEGNKGK